MSEKNHAQSNSQRGSKAWRYKYEKQQLCKILVALLTGTTAEAAILSDGGIMSGVSVKGGSMPLLVFCSIRYMARENCSRFNLPVCLVSASPLHRRNKLSSKLTKVRAHTNKKFGKSR